jgi:hypothetical protein
MPGPQLAPADQHRSAHELVGQFMAHWGALEEEMARAIRMLYGLGFQEGSILTANLGVSDKLAVLRAGIELRSRERMTKKWRAEADRFFAKRFDPLIRGRNQVAHTFFQPTDAGDVRFVRLQAKAEFKEIAEVWTRAEVDRRCMELDEAKYAVCELLAELNLREGLVLEPRLPGPYLDPATPIYRTHPEDGSEGA